jgi:hypothetical protein
MRRFGVTFTLGITEPSRRHALMLSRQSMGNALRCRVKPGRREDDADVWILTFIRLLGGFENGINSLVTMVGLCYFIGVRFHRLRPED